MDSTRGEPYEYQPELDAYLRALDRVLPDAVEGVYLTGSTALGDYHHGQSDLDLLTLTTRPLTESELAALDAAHKELEQGRQPHLDAVYVPREFVGKLPPRGADAELSAYPAVWFGTGPGRLHRTIATGEIISKARRLHDARRLGTVRPRR